MAYYPTLAELRAMNPDQRIAAIEALDRNQQAAYASQLKSEYKKEQAKIEKQEISDAQKQQKKDANDSVITGLGVTAASALAAPFAQNLVENLFTSGEAKAAEKLAEQAALKLAQQQAAQLGIPAATETPGLFGGLKNAVGGWFGGGGSQATNAATQVAGSLPSAATSALPAAASYTPAAAAAGAAPAAAGGFGSSAMGALGAAAPYLGIAGGGLGLYSGLKSGDMSPLSGVASGAALGAGLGSVLPGPGTVIGGAIGAGIGGIAGLTDQMFGSKDRWKTERNRLEELQKEGAYIPENLMASMPTQGRTREELTRQDLAPDFIGRDAQGNWVNNAFAQTRDTQFLRPEDVVNYSAWAEKDPNWFQKPLHERLGIAGQALQAGAIKEHHGTIDIQEGWNPGGAAPQGLPQELPELQAAFQQPAPQMQAPQPPPMQAPNFQDPGLRPSPMGGGMGQPPPSPMLPQAPAQNLNVPPPPQGGQMQGMQGPASQQAFQELSDQEKLRILNQGVGQGRSSPWGF